MQLDQEPPQHIALVLKTINDETFGVHTSKDALISELKTQVKANIQVPEERQRLIYRGRVLEDGQRLSTYNVEDGHTIHVVARPPLPATTAADTASASTQHEGLQQPQLGSIGAEPTRMAGLSSIAESLLARGADAAGRPAHERSQAPDNLEHIRQSMLTMFTLISTMSTVSANDFHDNLSEQETKQSEESESKENASTTRYPNRQFFVGQWLDVKDTVDQWLEATILDINDEKMLVHYNGWPSRWDEWIEFASPRIAPFRTRTSHVLSNVSNSPSPASVVAHAPTTGVNDMRAVLPDMVAMSKLMTSRLEELSQLYTDHRAHDPENSRFNRGGSDEMAPRLPWSSVQTLPSEEISFSTEKEARMNELAAELAPLCDRFGRAVVDLAPQLQRVGGSEAAEAAEAVEEEDQSPFQFLTRALGRSRRRSTNSPAATDRAYRQVISSTARGSQHAGGGNHLDIHIHAILTPTSGMFGGGGGGSNGDNDGAATVGSAGAGAAGVSATDSQHNRSGSNNPFLRSNPFRQFADLQNAPWRTEGAAMPSASNTESQHEGSANRNGSSIRRRLLPQPRLGMRTELSELAGDFRSTHAPVYLPPPPPHPAPAPPTIVHDDIDTSAAARPTLPPRATSDSMVAASATADAATTAHPPLAVAAPVESQAQSVPSPANSADGTTAGATDAEESSRNSGGAGLLRAVLRRWSRNFSSQG